jgi:flagellar biosynthesis protein FlhB
VAEAGAQEKTEEATPKRKREAREQGQVPRSRELSTAVVVGAGIAVLFSNGSSIAHGAVEQMRAALSISGALLPEPSRMPILLEKTLLNGMLLVAPVFAVTMFAALVSPMLLGGWNFALKAIQPDLQRINPISGLGRMFSSTGLVELAKSIAKFLLVGTIGAVSLWGSRDQVMGLGTESVGHGIAHGLALISKTMVWMIGALALIAAIDAPYQVWSYGKKLRMSKQEIREEYKQSEGRPEIKGRIRRIQQEISQRRMMEKVPTADVIVTNPTHYAVALQYTADKMRAPRVVAKGADLIAAAIRELGNKHSIPIVEAPPLARALYRGCELEQEIPASLYAAVAQVLTYVYQLRTWRGGVRPPPPRVGAVPGGEPDTETDQPPT